MGLGKEKEFENRLRKAENFFFWREPRLVMIQFKLLVSGRFASIGEKSLIWLSHPHPWSFRVWQSLLGELGRDDEWVRSPWRNVKPWQVVDMG